MTILTFIAFGVDLGAPLRYLINDLMKNYFFFALPSGVMLVNFIGSFATMSALLQQTIELLYNAKDLNVLIYVVTSIATCLIGNFSLLFI
tara:strand:+ start:17488 stop:17757 length:270 start_codon:yes stop_codon:yes gene_type:complete